MTAIDVGQGDSILVVFPDGKTMLVDGGGIPGFGGGEKPKIDTGEDVVAPYLWERSFRSIDVVALSHAHEDHIGGLPAIVDDFHPKELWTGATPEAADARQRLLAQSARQGRKGGRQDRPYGCRAAVRIWRRRRSRCWRRQPITFPSMSPRITIRW